MRSPTVLPLSFTRVPALGLLLLLCAWAPVAVADDAGSANARVIVKLRPGAALLQAEQAQAAPARAQAARQRMQALGRRLGLALQDGPRLAERTHVAVAAGLGSEQLAQRLRAQADVEYAVADHRRQAQALTPDDPLYPVGQTGSYPADGQWYLHAPDAVVVSGIDAPAAWQVSTGSDTVAVAVLDTGVRFDHIDFAGGTGGSPLLAGYNMISDPLVANNGVGRSADASDLGDWLTPTEISQNRALFGGCTARSTSSWHGTRTAGLVGARTNNATGMAGLGWNVKVLPVRVLGKCGGYDSDIIAGMRWAAGLPVDGVPAAPQPARVLNLSLGGTAPCTAAYLDAVREIQAKGVVIVASAGNSAGQAMGAPASCPGVVAVGGLRHAGTKVGYSSVGPEVALSAPGGNCVNLSGNCLYSIVTTINSGSTTPVSHAAGGSVYTDMGAARATYGTSFAAPLVSATAALMLSARPALQPAAVRDLLRQTTRAFPASGGTPGTVACHAPDGSEQLECYCTQSTCGSGMLDAGAALAAAADAAVAQVAVSPQAPVAGQVVTLDARGSLPASGAASIATMQWTLADGGGIVTTLSPTGDPAVVVAVPSANGSFRVLLQVTDDQGHTAQTEATVLVGYTGATSSSQSATNRDASNGEGGGGASGPWAAAGLALLAGALAARRRGF